MESPDGRTPIETELLDVMAAQSTAYFRYLQAKAKAAKANRDLAIARQSVETLEARRVELAAQAEVA